MSLRPMDMMLALAFVLMVNIGSTLGGYVNIGSPRSSGVCPAVSPGTAGICVERCRYDSDCTKPEKCCSNGCGHVCKKPCSPIMCRMYCAYGNKLDSNGCTLCRCNAPCDLVKCSKDETCVPRNCKRPPCKPPATCVTTCSLSKKVGPCEALLPRYFYDKAAKKCKQFNYGGCQGNENNFMTLAACLRTCDTECPVMVCNTKCTLMKDAEGCDMCECQDPCEEKQCPTGEVCVAKKVYCVRAPCPPIATCVISDKCNLPKEPGPCRGFFPRYYYDYKTGLCKKFIYGGCLGNANRFLKLFDCVKECVHVYST